MGKIKGILTNSLVHFPLRYVHNSKLYLAGRSFTVGEHMGEGRDDVDREADQESPNCRINGSKEGKDYSQEPYGYDNRQPR